MELIVQIAAALFIGFVSGMFCYRAKARVEVNTLVDDVTRRIEGSTAQISSQVTTLMQEAVGHAENASLMLSIIEKHHQDMDMTHEELMRVEMFRQYYTDRRNMTLN